MIRFADGWPPRADAGAREWLIDDEPTHLREWGTHRIHPLPPDGEALTLGTAEGCTLRLLDPSRRVSREHAHLSRERAGWVIRDLGSANGTRLDGARRSQFSLAPGAEVGIGPITLIAESPALIALRGYLARLLGWSPDQVAVIDRAVRAVRTAVARRAALHVCGPGDLVALARGLHLRTLGEARPFVICDPRRRRVAGSVRAAEGLREGLAALEAAVGGTVCVRTRRLPRDFPDVAIALREPACRAQLVVCTDAAGDPRTLLADPILIPPLARRRAELGRIIDGYARDAATSLGDTPGRGLGLRFTHADREWVREHAAGSLPEIEKFTRRLIAIRRAESIAQAATWLGMSHAALAQWIGQRRLP